MKLLVVCHGNIYRSPAASAVLSTLGFETKSCGVAARDGMPAAQRMRLSMAKLGYDLETHRSRKFSLDMAQWSDYIVCMDLSNVRRALVQGAPLYKVILLGGFEGLSRIPDPAYLKTRDVDDVADLIVRCCRRLSDQIDVSKEREAYRTRPKP